MVIRQKRDDTKIEHISGIPAAVRRKYRSDATLGYVLDAERVVSLSQLRKKYSKD